MQVKKKGEGGMKGQQTDPQKRLKVKTIGQNHKLFFFSRFLLNSSLSMIPKIIHILHLTARSWGKPK